GLDLHCITDAVIEPQATTMIGTGLAIKLPKRCVGIVKNRGSSAKAGLLIGGGVIDRGYIGEILQIVTNLHPVNQYSVKKGDQIAQLLIMPVIQPKIYKQIKMLKSSDTRGTQGFGSTGKGVYAATKITELQHKEENSDKHGYAVGKHF